MANAFCHRDYAVPGGTVAVAMYDDRLEITNPGDFHFGITPERLLGPHESKPWNPIIASVFHRAGIIERWGTGTLNIVDWCRENGNPAPAWTQESGTVVVTFCRVPSREEAELGPSRDQVGTKSGLNQHQVVILRRCLNENALLDLMNAVGRKNRTKFRDQFIKPLLDARLLEMTIPDKPNSRLQKYRTTAAGAKAISESESER
ncbi:MAG: hypothetical protein GXY44_03975 [Phycisphaerales bacterium]|nr:hypothetical protein [Phycisphaerales bacterium]